MSDLELFRIDENGGPVIVEYKRTRSDNVMGQGPFGLSCLVDHRAEFEHPVGGSAHFHLAGSVDRSTPWLICVACGLSGYDGHAVQQIGRAMDLVRYRHSEGHLLPLSAVLACATDSTTAAASSRRTPAFVGGPGPDGGGQDVSAADGSGERPGIRDELEQSSPQVREPLGALDEFCASPGDDVSRRTLKRHVASRRPRNVAAPKVRPVENRVGHLTPAPDSPELEEGFNRDLRSTERGPAVPLEVNVRTAAQLEGTYAQIQRAHENG